MMKHTVVWLLSLGFVGLSCPEFAFDSSFPQNEAVSQPTYTEVMDRAFRFSEGLPAELDGIQYRIVVRVMPSSGMLESQTIFLRLASGTTQIIEYKLKDGSRSVMDEYNEFFRKNRKAGISDILARVTVEKTQKAGSREIGQLVDNLLQLSLPIKLSTNICLDGITYEIWIQTPSNSIHASLSNCAFGENTASEPIFRWINELQGRLREEAAARIRGSKPVH
jgi:hypothetical protein